MRRSDITTILFLLSGFVPIAATAQQTTPDANQATQVQPQQTPQQSDQSQSNPVQSQKMQGQSGQAQNQNTPVEPPNTPQQTDQARRSADNRNWTAQQQAEERLKQAEERMIINRIRQRLMEENEDHQTTGQTSRRDGIDGPRYGSDGRDYYESRPYPRVKTCIEYENGDEFCRYRTN